MQVWRAIVLGPDGIALGEVDGFDAFQVSVGLSRNSTVSFKVPTTHKRLAALRSKGNLIQALRFNPRYVDGAGNRVGRWETQFAGRITARSIQAAAQGAPSMQVLAVGPAWWLGKRVADNGTGAGKQQAGLDPTGDSGKYLAQVIAAANAERNTRVQANPDDCSGVDLGGGDPIGGFKVVTELLAQLAGGAAGVDWYIRPDLRWTGTPSPETLVLGDFVCSKQLGVALDDTALVFEYGLGRANVSSLQIDENEDELANEVLNPQGNLQPPAPYLVERRNAISIGEPDGLLQKVITTQVTDTGLRGDICQTHIDLVSRDGRTTHTFTPAASDRTGFINPDTGRPFESVPAPLLDYQPGDWLRLRYEIAGIGIQEVALRIYAITVAVSASGQEQATITVTPE